MSKKFFPLLAVFLVVMIGCSSDKPFADSSISDEPNQSDVCEGACVPNTYDRLEDKLDALIEEGEPVEPEYHQELSEAVDAFEETGMGVEGLREKLDLLTVLK